MTFLIDITHLILAATLSFLGLGYEREQDAHAIHVAPKEVRYSIEGALLSPATLSVTVQNAQNLCAPTFAIQTPASRPEGPPLNTTAQIIILNDCETIPSRPALHTL